MTNLAQNDLKLAILILVRFREGGEALTSDRLRDKLRDLFEVDVENFGPVVGEAKELLKSRLIEYSRGWHRLTDEGRDVLAEIDKLVDGTETQLVDEENGTVEEWRVPTYKVIEAADFDRFNSEIAKAKANGGEFLPESLRFAIYDGKQFFAGVVKFLPSP